MKPKFWRVTLLMSSDARLRVAQTSVMFDWSLARARDRAGACDAGLEAQQIDDVARFARQLGDVPRDEVVVEAASGVLMGGAASAEPTWTTSFFLSPFQKNCRKRAAPNAACPGKGLLSTLT